MRERIAALRAAAAWLWSPELGACVVGSAALAEACLRAGVEPPRVGDIDLAWPLATSAGEDLLRARGAFVATTAANRARGTLAIAAGGQRYEVTSFRGDAPAGASYASRLELDLGLRDMTVGALAWQLADDTIVDPLDGLGDWRARRVVACGDPAARVREHPVRLLRYYRRAHEWRFTLDPAIRGLRAAPEQLAAIPAEAASAELRAGLLRCASPGELLIDLHAAGALTPWAPELDAVLAPYQPKATTLVAALRWAANRARSMADDERLAVLVAVLCRELDAAAIDALLDRLPSLSDVRARRLAHSVAALRSITPQFGSLPAATLADLYEQWFKGNAFAVEPFAIAASAHRVDADADAALLGRQLRWLRERCGMIDVGALWSRLGHDRTSFMRAVHEARSSLLHEGRPD